MRFSAQGKVILLGEHAVVYGVPALAGALADGVTVETSPGRGDLHVPAWDLTILASDPTKDDQPLGRAYLNLRGRLGLANTSPVDLTATFAIPTGAGLGSSASLAVAIARALVAAHELPANLVEHAAMGWETIIHGKPSGLDHTVADRGGFGIFVRGKGLTPIVAAQPVPLVIGHTGKERDTKGRVARVAELLAANEKEVRARFDAIQLLVEKGKRAVEKGALDALGAAMNENQKQLRALEVSCPEIERMCTTAVEAGALGAKLTGGGGGGCVIAIAPGHEENIRAAWKAAGFESFTTSVGGAA